MTTLIINADDFGFSPAVTDGILRSHREGILTSTTLMTNMPDRDRAIDLAGQTPSLGVGIHLNLTQGKPLTPCKKLLTSAGEFKRSLPKLFWALRSKDARHQAADELRAQIQYALDRHLSPTHVDSHKHVCHVPSLHDVLIEICKQTHIPALRCAREIRLPNVPLPLLYRIQVRYAHTLAKKAIAAGLHTTDWFFGLATTGKTTVPVWQTLLAHLPEGTGEVMVHPAYIHDLTRHDTRLLQERLTEMEALCAPSVKADPAPKGRPPRHLPHRKKSLKKSPPHSVLSERPPTRGPPCAHAPSHSSNSSSSSPSSASSSPSSHPPSTTSSNSSATSANKKTHPTYTHAYSLITPSHSPSPSPSTNHDNTSNAVCHIAHVSNANAGNPINPITGISKYRTPSSLPKTGK